MLLPILFIVVFIALSVPFVAAPLRRRNLAGATSSDRDQTGEDADYKAMLLALRDLEFDHDLGVVSDEDYARLRPQMMAQAASALETGQKVKAEKVSADIEAAVRARRQQSQERHAPRFCSQCGRPLDRGDRFCAGCGSSLQ